MARFTEFCWGYYLPINVFRYRLPANALSATVGWTFRYGVLPATDDDLWSVVSGDSGNRDPNDAAHKVKTRK